MKSNYVNIQSRGTWVMLCLVLFSCIMAKTVNSADMPEKHSMGKDDQAWQELSVERDRFWRDAEDSPALVQRSAWPLIKGLKHFIQYYPRSSHIPEAYYLLGEAYSSIGYSPEAAGHWRTVVRYYPDSEWAGPALTALVKQLEITGNRMKIIRFYREILRQFPDSNAALMARVLLAEDAFMEGRLDLVMPTVERLEKTPSVELQVPEFLRLKAMIAERQGEYAKAREYLLHYLNLVKSRKMRASALFSIAESYRREGQLLKARKYYALIRRDFSSEPEALFARFRLAQLEDRARGRLSVYVSTALKPENMPATARLYARILKEFPAYPLSQEVQFEFMQLRMKQGKYLDALKLGYDFLKRMPDSVFAAKVRKTSLAALNALEKHRQTVAVLQEFVEFGLPVVKAANRDDPVSKGIAEATQRLWLQLLRQMTDQDMNREALASYRQYRDVYGKLQDKGALREARPLALKALASLDAAFLRDGDWTGLINYHFTWHGMMEELALSSHWYALARCWDAITCPDAALRAYYRAWKLHPDEKRRCPMLDSWIECAIRNRDHVSAAGAMELLDAQCPDNAFSAHVLELKARLEVLRGRWREATALFRDSVREGGGLSSRIGLMEGSIMLGDWKTAGKLRSHIWEKVQDSEKKRLLCLWGDEAFRLQEYGVALEAYESLMALDPQDPATAWKVARTRELTGDLKTAMEEFKALSQADSPLWAQAADTAIKNRGFWSSVPEEIR
jgi:TolA-binding protein